MEKVISSERIPIKMWLSDIEEGALEQAKHAANIPFAYRHVALMGDAHQGYGVSIGSVLATENVVIPNAVGVDISCGVCAAKTNLRELDQETIKKIFGGSAENHGGIRSAIPVGMNHHRKAQDERLMPIWNKEGMCLVQPHESLYHVVSKEYQSALHQLGTLGGGNHFIELQKGNDGHIWIMIHSGSRNLGYKVAKYYNELAYDLNTKWYSQTYLPKNKEDSLAFLPVDSEEGQAYLREMNYCVEFALANRKLMMDTIQNIMLEVCKDDFERCKFYSDQNCDFEPMINIAHNYVVQEHHFGKDVWVHRKGATLAREGTIGLIPGSQGSKSYVVRGLGNPESFNSCSHGAGRKMSRTKACETLVLEDEIKRMDDMGIVHGLRNKSDLDEAAGSYKDISVVMDQQKDLVEILVELTPLGVIKG